MGGVGVEDWTTGWVVKMGGGRVHVGDCWDGTLLRVDFQDCHDAGQGSEGVWKPGLLLFDMVLRTEGISGSGWLGRQVGIGLVYTRKVMRRLWGHC